MGRLPAPDRPPIVRGKGAAARPLTAVPMSPREVREAETFAAYKFYKRVLSEGRSAYVPFARSMYRRYRTGRTDLRLLRHALRYALILCRRRLRRG